MNDEKRIVVALTSLENDIDAWSGVNYYLSNAIKKKYPLNKYIYIQESDNRFLKLLLIIFQKAYAFFHKNEKEYFIPRWYYRLSYFKSIKEIKKEKADYIFTTSVILSSFVKNKNIIYIIDATVHLMVGYQWFNISKKTLSVMERNQLMALRNAYLVVCASDWASGNVIDYYGKDPTKVVTIPFGANFSFEKATKKHLSKDINVLFCAVLKKEKGFDVAVSTIHVLNNNDPNHKYRLVVLGMEGNNTDSIIFLGKKDKKDKKEYQEFKDAFRASHLFFLPTRAEAFGIVFCEACAFSLPVVGTDTGGVSTYVKNNYNGVTIAVDEKIESIANKIMAIVNDEELYETMSNNSRLFYENYCNWDSFVTNMNKALMDRGL